LNDIDQIPGYGKYMRPHHGKRNEDKDQSNKGAVFSKNIADVHLLPSAHGPILH